MPTPLMPRSIHPPFARYAHGMAVEAGARLVFCSGQLGIDPAGHIPADVAGQARLCFTAIAAILAEAGMTLGDLVRLNAYVTAREHLPAYMAARDAVLVPLGGPPAASTLMIVTGFARPEFLVEVEAVAAQSPRPGVDAEPARVRRPRATGPSGPSGGRRAPRP